MTRDVEEVGALGASGGEETAFQAQGTARARAGGRAHGHIKKSKDTEG